MGVAFFVVAAFFAGAFLVPVVVFCLLTRPDLVFLRTVGTSVTAGAYEMVSRLSSRRRVWEWDYTGASVLVLVFGARLVAVLALGLAVVAFLGVAAFFTLVAAVLGFAALGLVAFGLASLASLGAFSFCTEG